MKKFRLKGALAVAAAAIVATAGSASATTGGSLYNSPASNYRLSITNTHPAGNWTLVYPGNPSPSGFNVQGFLFKAGCKAKSQYSGSSWPYVGGTVYYYSQNNLALTITVSCP